MRRNVTIGIALAMAGCSGNDTTLPAGNLSDPVALALAPSPAGTRLFIAGSTGDDLRVFDTQAQLFLRGPNAISPLSLPVGFRPGLLAGGEVGGHGFVAVAGADESIVVVDAHALRVSPSAGAPCDGVTPQAACLPGSATGLVWAGSAGRLLAPLQSRSGGPATLATLTVTLVDGVPVVTLESLRTLPAGQPRGVATTADGGRVWVADRSAARVWEFTSGMASDAAPRELQTGGPVDDVVLSPAWTSETGVVHPAGELLLAILVDGRLQVIDPVTGAPPVDPYAPGQPLQPLSFGSPVRSLTFVPCAGGAGSCTTPLRFSTARLDATRGLGFVGLGDGTAVAIAPDPARPTVYRAVTRSVEPAQISAATYTEPDGAALTAPTIEGAAVNTGFTRSEEWRLTWGAPVPGLRGRAAVLSVDAQGVLLTDTVALPSDAVQSGDTVELMPLGASCPSLTAGRTLTTTGLSAGALRLTESPDALAGCLPVRVSYTVRAGLTAPWVVQGSATGYAGRAGMGADVTLAPEFSVAGNRIHYPDADATTGLLPAPGPALRFRVVGTGPYESGALISFSTSSGLVPFVVGTEGLASVGGGLGASVVATPERLYLGQVATTRVVQVKLESIGQAGGTIIYE